MEGLQVNGWWSAWIKEERDTIPTSNPCASEARTVLLLPARDLDGAASRGQPVEHGAALRFSPRPELLVPGHPWYEVGERSARSMTYLRPQVERVGERGDAP